MAEKSGKADKHVWTPEEDELLIHCMMLLHDKGELICEGGLRPRVLNQLKEMLHGLIPGCVLKAHPHVQSRVKKLKSNYYVVNDLLNLSCFGWDAEKKCVTAPKEVWDEYVKVNKDVSKFRNKLFPYYNELHDVFGKDRATGKEAQACDDVVEEINDNNTDHLVDMDVSHENHSTPENNPQDNTETNNTPSEATSESKKRKRKNIDRDEVLLIGLEKVANGISQGIRDASKLLGMHVDRVERDKRIDGMKESLYDELMEVEGLSHQEHLYAYVKMISDESMLIGFFKLPQEGKADVVHHIIS